MIVELRFAFYSNCYRDELNVKIMKQYMIERKRSVSGTPCTYVTGGRAYDVRCVGHDGIVLLE